MREEILAHMHGIHEGKMTEAEEVHVELVMFEPARNEILRLMTRDSFPRFKKTDKFKVLLETTFAPYGHASHIKSLQNKFKEDIVFSSRAQNLTSNIFQRFLNILSAFQEHHKRRKWLIETKTPSPKKQGPPTSSTNSSTNNRIVADK
jgi:hypothetical protein